ncbi:MAG TPA: aconitate hydratase [Bacteroidia bacterium]|nr:aconitate hydratase [Bacteroidia bacterium]
MLTTTSPQNITNKLIRSHLISGDMIPGKEISLKIDQTLTQDATGTLIMLELEALDIKKAKTELSVQYVDHNIIETDSKNAEDHAFLLSAAEKYGIWYSRAGNGISHPLHIHHFGIPGKTLLGSDSHTPSGGALGMLAIGTGGLDVALAIAGEPYNVTMPFVYGVELKGKLPAWVSAKDIALEMLRIFGVSKGRGYIFEYYGEGLKDLSVMDRLVIANMGTEMGATTTVFPSDEETKRFLTSQLRPEAWVELTADKGATYDKTMTIDLSSLEPLIACPSSPGNIKKVREVAGLPVHQVVVGSSANPGLRDYIIVSEIMKDKTTPASLSFDVNPSTRQVIENLCVDGRLSNLIKSGARFHQTGCLGCIGMGQAPAEGKISLRTMPRNFPGRSGTLDDKVYLCSPETAAAAALTGKITDPRDLEKLFGIKYPKYEHPKKEIINLPLLFAPLENNEGIELEKGSNIKPIPKLDALANKFEAPVILKVGDDISTDEILSGGTKVLPLRSNIPEISKWAYHQLDNDFYDKALKAKEKSGGHIIVAGKNYAQGSSREHAALAPKYLGQIVVIAIGYARIGWQNLINFGILPFELENEADYKSIDINDVLKLENINEEKLTENKMIINNCTKKTEIKVKHRLSERQIQVVLAGGMINYFKQKNK